MRWKLFTAAVLGAVLMLLPLQGKAYAIDDTVYEDYEKAIGLIEKCTLSCTTGPGGVIKITAKTQLSSEMEEVSYKSFTVQFSEDGEEWTDYQQLNDISATDSKYFNINNLKVQADKSGFYRVVCYHYAKGVPYGDTETRIQAVYNESPPTYVTSPAPVVTTISTSAKKAVTTTTKPYRTVARKTTTRITTRKTTAKTTAKTPAPKQPEKTAEPQETPTTAKAKTTAKKKTTTTKAKTTTKIKTTTTATTTKKKTVTKTGVEFPVDAVTVLIGAGGAVFVLRKKK